MEDKTAERIQTSILNGVEKKVLVWLAQRQPKWVVSDTMTIIGMIGAIMIGGGYMLARFSPQFLWISVLGFIVNWYGDSLDGTIARVRGTQRPIYGYYLDHTVDIINEAIMFGGMGLSYLMRFDLALMIFIVYLCLTLNVSVNAHLKSEFKLTYAKLGPTEFRIVGILITMALIFIRPLRTFRIIIHTSWLFEDFRALDIAGLVILIALLAIYITTVIKDAKGYAKVDPMPEPKEKE